MDETKKIIASVLVGSSIVGGAILQVQPREIPMTESKVYLMGEILQGRTPEYDLTKYKIEDISKDYAEVQVMVGDNVAEAVNFCKQNRKDKECNLYERILAKLQSENVVK